VTAEADLLPAGLVLGHRVWVSRVAVGGLAHRGRVAGLDPVTVRLDRAGSSDTFRVGELVRAAHPGREAVAAMVVSAVHGRVVMMLLLEEE
jgi:hypothetical protein